MTAKARRDLYAEITGKLVAAIEADPGTPQLPWRRNGHAPLWIPRNATTAKPRRDINVIALRVFTAAAAAARIVGYLRTLQPQLEARMGEQRGNRAKATGEGAAATAPTASSAPTRPAGAPADPGGPGKTGPA